MELSVEDKARITAYVEAVNDYEGESVAELITLLNEGRLILEKYMDENERE